MISSIDEDSTQIIYTVSWITFEKKTYKIFLRLAQLFLSIEIYAFGGDAFAKKSCQIILQDLYQ